MRRGFRALVAAIVVATASSVAIPAQAAFHLIYISEVFAGTPSAPNARFVELQMYSAGQNQVQTHSVVVYNAAGTQVGTYSFSDPVANQANQTKILVATPEAQTLFGITADLTMGTATIPTAGGKVCFDNIDCVSWGTYSGSATAPSPTGTPAPEFCDSLTRRLNIAGGPTTLDGADDTNNSANDFVFALPTPVNNAGQAGNSVSSVCFQFQDQTLTTSEAPGDPTVVTGSVLSSASSETRSVELLVGGGSATGGSDYQVPSPNPATLTFTAGDGTEDFSVTILDDAEAEATETIQLTLQNASSGTRIVAPTGRIQISDDDGPPPDTADPSSRITKPLNNRAYARDSFTKVTGTASDTGGSGLTQVQAAIRQKLKSGSCKWFMGASRGFEAGSCATKKWRTATGLGNWTLSLGAFRLPKSDVAGSNVAYYTGFSRAKDVAGNVEASFVVGRNANRFEIT